jgi:hypothetical protein
MDIANSQTGEEREALLLNKSLEIESALETLQITVSEKLKEVEPILQEVCSFNANEKEPFEHPNVGINFHSSLWWRLLS